MLYFVGPKDQGFLTATSNLFPPPDGWTEVTYDDYTKRLEAQRAIAEEHAADPTPTGGAPSA